MYAIVYQWVELKCGHFVIVNEKIACFFREAKGLITRIEVAIKAARLVGGTNTERVLLDNRLISVDYMQMARGREK